MNSPIKELTESLDEIESDLIDLLIRVMRITGTDKYTGRGIHIEIKEEDK